MIPDLSHASPSSSPATHPPHWLTPAHGRRLLYPLFTFLNVALILLLYYYIWRLFCRSSRRLDQNHETTSATAPSSTVSSPSASMRNGRLDSDLLSSIPVFVYSISDDAKLECSVCLAECKDGEKGRLLPGCSHRFHADCIDMWLQCHSTCPICRSAVEPKSPGSDDAV